MRAEVDEDGALRIDMEKPCEGEEHHDLLNRLLCVGSAGLVVYFALRATKNRFWVSLIFAPLVYCLLRIASSRFELSEVFRFDAKQGEVTRFTPRPRKERTRKMSDIYGVLTIQDTYHGYRPRNWMYLALKPIANCPRALFLCLGATDLEMEQATKAICDYTNWPVERRMLKRELNDTDVDCEDW